MISQNGAENVFNGQGSKRASRQETQTIIMVEMRQGVARIRMKDKLAPQHTQKALAREEKAKTPCALAVTKRTFYLCRQATNSR